MTNKAQDSAKSHNKCMLSRRDFLLYSGAATTVALVPITVYLSNEETVQAEARVVGYQRKKIAQLSQLNNHQPVFFSYPENAANSAAMLVKTDIECGGGLGEQKDIVAYSMICTHKGGPLSGTYKAVEQHRIAGQCPFHLSTFDLRRHGIIVSGQAYESLPQIMLEIEGDDIYATGVMGLVFGHTKNETKEQEV